MNMYEIEDRARTLFWVEVNENHKNMGELRTIRIHEMQMASPETHGGEC